MALTPRLVLAISLDTSKPEAEVLCELKRKTGKASLPLDDWRFTAAKMGLPESLDRRKALYQGYEFELPEDVLGAMQGWVQGEAGQPLWLRLEKPSGYLRLVPWEQLLQPRIGVPILRLPDFETEPPRETPGTLDVLLCGSLPFDENPFPIGEYLERTADRILGAVPSRRTTLHVFTDQAVYHGLRQRWEAAGKLGSEIRLYDPATAEPYAVPDPTSRIQDPAGSIENPWLLWMRDSLRGRSVDVVHFLTHGYLSGDRGALALAESPLRNTDRSLSRFVGGVELSTFLTQVGAWSAAFSSPEHNYSEMGLRLLADSIAQSRPGPVLHHEARLDTGCAALAQAYRFLYGPAGTGSLGGAPASPALLLYCPVPRAGKPKKGVSFGMQETAAPKEALQAVFESQENVPAWVAAATRSIEQYNLRLQKLADAPAELGQQLSRQADLQPVQETLRQIQEIVARAAVTKEVKP